MMPELPYYQFIEQIGHGGTGAVYKAIDERSGHMVAVKMLFKKAFENEFVREKFMEEANRYLYLDHPNIVGLNDFIIRDEGYYLVMEYVKGLSLDKYMQNVTGAVPEEVAVAMITEVLQAIGFAHEQGVVHLDMKPANIMVGDDGSIKVLDFGIATERGEKQFRLMGSPLYMAPEQIKGADVDEQTDIYSLGVTLYQMLTGEEPYPTNITKEELFQRILHSPFLNRSGARTDLLSRNMQRIIKRATEREKTKRFQSCREFIAALQTVYHS